MMEEMQIIQYDDGRKNYVNTRPELLEHVVKQLQMKY